MFKLLQELVNLSRYCACVAYREREARVINTAWIIGATVLPWLGNYLLPLVGWDRQPTWSVIMLTIILILVAFLLMLACHARRLETPVLSIMHNQSPEFIRTMVAQDGSGALLGDFYIGVRNVSAVPVEGVEVCFASHQAVGSTEVTYPNFHLYADNAPSKVNASITINPGDMKFYRIAQLKEPNPRFHFIANDEYKIGYLASITVSGKTSPIQEVKIRLGFFPSNSNTFIFEIDTTEGRL